MPMTKYDCLLSYAKEDISLVQEAYLALRRTGVKPWMDKPPTPFDSDGLLPGQDWEMTIRRAIKSSTYFIPFFSENSVNKSGFVQREFRQGLQRLAEQSQDSIYVVSVLLDSCEVPQYEIGGVRFDQYQWLDCPNGEYHALVQFFERENKREDLNEVESIFPSSADALLDAISSNSDVLLSGKYDLSNVRNVKRSHVWISSTYDGIESTIHDVRNLRIRPSTSHDASIVISHAYRNVISFENSRNCSIDSLTIGHENIKGNCVGGVVKFKKCVEMYLTSLKLYGCGTYGIELSDCERVVVSDTDIYQCSYGIILVDGSRDVLFRNCRFYDNAEFTGLGLTNCKNIMFENSKIHKNNMSGYFLECDRSTEIVFKDCDFAENVSEDLCRTIDQVTFINTAFSGNSWQ
jgi:TIR domain/Right handed beta helix region